jgi:alpha-glucosidase
MSDSRLWWRDGVIYQIYPRSFMDSNADGLGDLNGIRSRLDYLQQLGVDAIWLSPIYPSPDKDFGYDVSDYTGIDPRYGSMGDFDNLVLAAHQRGIHIILDLVLNHTSDQHPWFKESRSSRENPYRDWYLWRPAQPDGSPPNNWQSIFGGGGWKLDPLTNEYYFHMFLPEQPDVNWRNPAVRQAMLAVFRFWLERGVDGFRLDVFNAYFKDADLKNNPSCPGLRAFDRQRHINDADQPEMIPLLQEIRALLDKYPERYMVGETFLATPRKAIFYTGRDKAHAAFNFSFTGQPWNAEKMRRAIQEWEELNGPDGWPNYVLNNHDTRRSASRYHFADDDVRAKAAAMLLLTLRGTPFLYYGEEIGMRDVSMKYSEIMDPPGKLYWPIFPGRDGCRSPMQWDASVQAGFSPARPWLKVHPAFRERNAAEQQADPDSLLNFYQTMVKLRREHASLHRGSYTLISDTPRGVLAYLRQAGNERMLVAINFTRGKKILRIPEGYRLSILLDTKPKSAAMIDEQGNLHLHGDQGVILMLSGAD